MINNCMEEEIKIIQQKEAMGREGRSIGGDSSSNFQQQKQRYRDDDVYTRYTTPHCMAARWTNWQSTVPRVNSIVCKPIGKGSFLPHASFSLSRESALLSQAALSAAAVLMSMMMLCCCDCFCCREVMLLLLLLPPMLQPSSYSLLP